MRYPVVIRRIVSQSMLPTLPENTLVVATGFYRSITKGDLVIFKHQGIDKIKRVEDIRAKDFYDLGDNRPSSSDSRTFGWLTLDVIEAKVIWPKVKR